MHALRALNAAAHPSSPPSATPGLSNPKSSTTFHLNLDIDPTHEILPAGFTSYIDLLLRDRARFVSVHHHQQFLDRLVRRAAPLDHPHAMLDCVIRPALLDLAGPQEGFAITLYIKALGHDPGTAQQHWSAALEAIILLLRAKDIT